MESFRPSPLDGFSRLRWKSQGKEKFLSNLTRVILPGPDTRSRLRHHVAKSPLLADGEDRFTCRQVFVKFQWNLRAVVHLGRLEVDPPPRGIGSLLLCPRADEIRSFPNPSVR